MMANLPLVSIITPVYNAAQYLHLLIESVQNQAGQIAFEHILIDDFSTDDSLAILMRLAEGDKRIKVIGLNANSGPVAARNNGILNAQGKYLAFLDADDYWLPDKLWIQTSFMEKSGAVLTFTDYRFISEDGSLIGPRLCGPNRIGWRKHHMSRSGLGCLTVMINREKCTAFSFKSIGPIADMAEDFTAWSGVISQHGPALRVPYDLARYRVVGGSRSSNIYSKALSVWTIYRHVEKINFLMACFYFFAFVIAAISKRYFYRPKWPLTKIDGPNIIRA